MPNITPNVGMAVDDIEITPAHVTVTENLDVAMGLEGADSGGGLVNSVDGKIGDVEVLPTGGTTGQVLKKASEADYDVEWADESGGTGISDALKQALLQIAQKAAYIDDGGPNYYAALYAALYTVTAITLDVDTLSLNTGETQQINAVTTPAGGLVSWSSSDEAVATVSDAGLVTATGAGSATITATSGSVSASCAVTVSAVELVSISASYVQSGTVYTTDALSVLIPDLTVTANWSDSTTTTVDSSDYVLSGTLTEGTSTITVTYSEKTDTFSVTVTAASETLDTIVYEGKSYRDIFMTGNQVHGFDWENGLPAGVSGNSGSPSITTDDCYSTSHCMKAYGTTSQQYKSVNTSGVADWNKYNGKIYFTGFKCKVTRYVKGNIGVSVTAFNTGPTAVTDGWQSYTKYTNTTGTTASTAYIGSRSSANLDGYVDDIVMINLTDMFTTVPSEADMITWYNAYCDLRKAGEN